MQSITLTIINKFGLHARAAAKLSSLAERFASDITIERDGHSFNAKSIMQVMMIAASHGTEITVTANGKDEVKALAAISKLVNGRFDEAE